MWINHLVQFEQRNNGVRRLILGFYETSGMSVKVFQKQMISIPTRFIHYQSGDLERIVERIKKDSLLENFELQLIKANNDSRGDYSGVEVIQTRPGNYHVLKIIMPNDPIAEKRLPYEFQRGDYDKMLRLAGHHPERKVTLSPEMEIAFKLIDNFQLIDSDDKKQAEEIDRALKSVSQDNFFAYSPRTKKYEANLSSSRGITYQNEFLSPEEISKVSAVYYDIEKPLWKHEDERKRIAERNELIKEQKRRTRNK